jgi:hypothetical protein
MRPIPRLPRTVTVPKDASEGLANKLTNKTTQAARRRPVSG